MRFQQILENGVNPDSGLEPASRRRRDESYVGQVPPDYVGGFFFLMVLEQHTKELPEGVPRGGIAWP